MSLVVSDTEELLGSINYPAPFPSLEPSEAKAGMDTKLFRIPCMADEELGLEWSPSKHVE